MRSARMALSSARNASETLMSEVPGMREGISDRLDLPGVRHHLSVQLFCMLWRQALHRSQNAEVVVQEQWKVTHIQIVEDIVMRVSNDTGGTADLAAAADNFIPGLER